MIWGGLQGTGDVLKFFYKRISENKGAVSNKKIIFLKIWVSTQESVAGVHS